MKKITLLFIFLTYISGYGQDPATGPADPPARNASDVISFYNGIASPVAPEYTNEPSVVLDPFDGATTVGNITLADGNNVFKYTSHKYSGIGSGNYDVSSMTTLHIDVYSPDFTVFAVKLEATNGSQVELAVSDPKVQGAWNSYDIDLSLYSAVDLANLKWIVPVTFEGTGTTLYLDNVYFSKPPTDPLKDVTLSDLQVDGTTISGFGGSIISYSYNVPTGSTTVPQITLATPTEAGNGATATITNITSIPGDATVLVTSADATVTETYTISIAEVGPATAAPTPPARNAEDVVSIYSDAYTPISPINYDAGWCGANAVTATTAGGDAVFAYNDQACQGIDFGSDLQDVTDLINIHVDLFIQDGTDLIGKVFNMKIVPSTGAETEFNIDLNALSPAPVPGTWYSYDAAVTLSGTTTDIKQFGITSNLQNAVWYDNLYLYKEFFAPGTCDDGIMNQDETGIDCGGTISGCEPCSGPPTTAAPTPPARDPADVISFYSDAYTDVVIDAFDFGLCDGGTPNLATAEVMIDGNPTQNYLGSGCQGISIETNRVDASAFTNLHFDFFTDVSGTDLIGKVFNIKLVDWAGNATEAGASGLEINFNDGTSPGIITSSWVSVDVDITSIGGMVGGNLTRSDIAQIHITSNLPNAWYDNLYLHKNTTTLGIENNELIDFNTYPNPTQESWTVKTKSEIMSSIIVYDILGKQVISLSPNSIETTIDGTSLKTGLYFAQIKTESGLSNIKLIKN